MFYCYPEYRFYMNQWYPVNKPLNIPKCNMKQLYPRKYLNKEEILGFYMIYSNPNLSISVDGDSVTMKYGINGISGDYKSTGSLYVHAPESLINIAASPAGSIQAHMNLEVIVRVSNDVPSGINYTNEVFRNPETPSEEECRSVKILPYFVRKTDYCTKCTMSFHVPDGYDQSISLGQKILSVSVNGEDYPVHIFTDDDWVNAIDPFIFFNPDIRPIPAEMLV